LQNISSEIQNEGPRIAVVTHREAIIGATMKNKGKHIEQWVRKLVGPIPTLDPQQENDTYQRERK
jgi:hypothetical protein